MRYDARGQEVYPEQELDPEELADYYDARGIEWRRPRRSEWNTPASEETR